MVRTLNIILLFSECVSIKNSSLDLHKIENGSTIRKALKNDDKFSFFPKDSIFMW